MRARAFVILSTLALFAGGCTAFIASQLSGDDASTSNDKVGDCYALPNNQCGQCIAQNCENPNGDPPVSLAAVCKFQAPDTFHVQECANDPTVGYPDNCSELFKDGGTYAKDISQQSQAENNVNLCVRDKCMPSCRTCAPSVPYCGDDSTPLADAGACGACFDQNMNWPSSPCQQALLTSDFQCDEETQNAIAACAVPPGDTTCITPDCTPFETATTGLYACLWQQCASSCQ